MRIKLLPSITPSIPAPSPNIKPFSFARVRARLNGLASCFPFVLVWSRSGLLAAYFFKKKARQAWTRLDTAGQAWTIWVHGNSNFSASLGRPYPPVGVPARLIVRGRSYPFADKASSTAKEKREAMSAHEFAQRRNVKDQAVAPRAARLRCLQQLLITRSVFARFVNRF